MKTTHDPPLILVVDDEPNLLEISKMRLESAGFSVITASDAEEAFERVRKFKPDLVLLDIKMPGINGTEALLDFKNDQELRSTHVAFLTNLAVPWPGISSDNEKFARELGAITLLDKSKDLDDLPKLTEKILTEIYRDDLKYEISEEIEKVKS